MSQRGNKNAQKWGKGISRGVGAAIGGIAGGGSPQAIALGAQVGGLLDPLYDYMYPVYHENHLIKKNIGSGTMSDNYQYGKTEDSFSMDFMSKDPMEKFNKILGHVDTGIQLGGMIGGDLSGLAKKNFTEGTKAASGILTGGVGGASPMQTGKGVGSTVGNFGQGIQPGGFGLGMTSTMQSGLGLLDYDKSPFEVKPRRYVPSIMSIYGSN